MGAWSAAVMGNDTAQDLKIEYQVAFSRFDPEEAVRRLDEYVRNGLEICEDDAVAWCDYRYSVADFMWKHGVLTADAKDAALKLIDGGAGLAAYAEAGFLAARKKALAKLRDQITSPQPPRKKIAFDWHTTPVFETGDVIALQFRTANKPYFADCRATEAAYRALDGKLFVLRKVYDAVSCVSGVDPSVRDIWPNFQLYDKIFDTMPTMKTLKNTAFASDRRGIDVFFCEGVLRLYQRRHCVVVGSDKSGVEQARSRPSEVLPLSDWKYGNADTEIINLLNRA